MRWTLIALAALAAGIFAKFAMNSSGYGPLIWAVIAALILWWVLPVPEHGPPVDRI